MSSVGELVDRKDKPAYVKFKRVAKENKLASEREGRFVGTDVDMVHITPPYSKDVFICEVKDWFPNLANDVRNGRIPQEWVDAYRDAYERWKKGEVLPLNGTPIKGWGVTSPAQQETLISLNILTVEDLADVNDEGLHRIGMGAVELKNKARAWLAQLKDKGPLTQKMAALESENAVLRASVDTLTRQVQELMSAVKRQDVGVDTPPAPDNTEIAASDILDDDAAELTERYKTKFGKAPHHLMKPDTIRRALLE